jgi:hypothetical protein
VIEVSKMTDQQLNRELAELMGWINIREDGFGGFWGQPADDRWSNALPAYCTDPAASLEVQAAAMSKNCYKYVRNLNVILGGKLLVPTIKLITEMLTATPRQRAEAAYMTLKGE